MTDNATRTRTGLKLVALLELTKGVLVLAAGFGLLSLLHQDVGLAAEDLVRLFHLNPASHTPRIFIEAAAALTDARLWMLAAAALGYSLVRVVEASGLWLRKAWAEWFGALAGGVYIPIEIYEVIGKITWLRVGVLGANLIIVGYLALELWRGKSAQKREPVQTRGASSKPLDRENALREAPRNTGSK